MTTEPPINRFEGPFAAFSNFHGAPVKYEGLVYAVSENAFQAAKTLDQDKRKAFRNVSPGAAKKMGRALDLRPDWETVKFDVMLTILRTKFQDSGMKQLLLSTGNRPLEEGVQWHDICWGRCYCSKCRGKGQNHLGRLLMQVRDELRSSGTVDNPPTM